MTFAWDAVLEQLVAGRDLSLEEAHGALSAILAGEATPGQIGGFLVALRVKGVTADELCGVVRAMLESAERVTVVPEAIDTCGTGGSDQRRLAAFNVSTIAALVVAGAGGKVCKHGNRRASATSGSADVLEALGVAIDLDGAGVAACVERSGIGFLLAPRFHAGMRHAGPVRRELGIRTVFNFAGPLANPAGVRRQVVGVADGTMAPTVARVLIANEAERAMVVFGHDGLDELTVTGPSTLLEVRDGLVTEHSVEPEQFGFKRRAHAPEGGDTTVNAELTRRVLDGEVGPHRDIVVLNAAAGLLVADVVDDLAAGVEAAIAALDSGAAGDVLDSLVTVSNEVRPAK
ncbi:MAG TPA: anthranilate phosphoribosyltransferase [Acidimicrobiales bacterium]|nr:anthranilate phosphoribosyltransferase [Acidimicrobiales bacterium]